MTVSTTTSRITYSGDGVSTVFAIPFIFFGSGEIQVIEKVTATGVETTKTLTTDYTVSGGNGSTGTATAVVAPAAGVTWTIARNTNKTQLVDYVENDPFPASTHERALDRLTAITQELDDANDRSLKLSPTSSVSELTLPDPEADKYLGWKSDLSGIENKSVPAGTAVYASLANTNAGATATEAVTPSGLNASKFNPNGKHLVPILAAAMQPAITNGPALASIETTTNKVNYRALDFDTSTQEFACFSLPMPKSWDEGAVTFRARWTAASGSGGVAWALQAVAVSDDDALDVAYGTEQVVTDTFITAGDLHTTVESAAITIAGTPAEGDVVLFRVKRVPANASDTLGVDARLIAIDLFMTTNTGTDA